MKKKLVMFLMAMMVSATAVGVISISANAAELTEEQQTTMSESVSAIAVNPQAIQVMSTIFDAEYYATTYPDVVAIVGNDAQALFAHYISFGIGEGRDASASFNLDAYVAANPDLVDAFASLGMEINAASYINHYAASGINEGRVSTVAGAVEKGITVPSLTNSEVVLAQPVAPTPKKKVWATGGGGGGSTPASDSASETSSDSNNSASDSDREAVRQMWSNMPDEVFNSLSDEDIQILLNNENAVIGSDNKVYASQEEFMAAMTSYQKDTEYNGDRDHDFDVLFDKTSEYGKLYPDRSSWGVFTTDYEYQLAADVLGFPEGWIRFCSNCAKEDKMELCSYDSVVDYDNGFFESSYYNQDDSLETIVAKCEEYLNSLSNSTDTESTASDSVENVEQSENDTSVDANNEGESSENASNDGAEQE